MKLLLPLLFALAALAAPASTFSFWFTSPPTQCANTTVQWSGGQPPYTLLLVPVGHLNPETRTIEQINIEQGNQATFPLRFPAQSQFVAVLNDATGIGSGGTSIVTTVSSSSTTSCLNTQPVSPKFTFSITPSTPASCSPLDISWHSNAEEPIDILGLIPGGESFTIANITDPSSQASQSQAQSDLLEFNWTAVNLRSGTDILIVAGDKDGLGSGGSSDVLSVQPNVGGDMHCISANSPSSTPGNPAGGVYTFVPNPAGGNSGSGSGSGQTTDNGGAAGTSPTPMPSEGSGSGSGSGLGSGSNNGLGESGSGNPTAGSGIGNGGAPGSPSTTDAGAGSGSAATATGTVGGTGASGGVGSGTETGTGTGGVGTGTSVTGILNPSQTNDPGSSGGTVTGPPDPSSHNSRLPLILALTLGLLALLALFIGAFILYRRHKRSQARQSAYATYPYPRSYGGTRPGRATSRFSFPFSLPIPFAFPWMQHENDSESDLLTGPRVNRGSGIGTRMRGGDASVETLGGSMYRTEPFIVPPVHPSHLSDSAHERDRMGLGGGPGYNTDGYFLLPPGAAAATLPRPAMVRRGSSLFLQPTSTAEKGLSRVYANPTPARKGAMPPTTSPGTQTVLAPLLTHNLSTTAGDGHSPAITRAGSRNPFLAMSMQSRNDRDGDGDGRLGLGIATPASPEEESAATAAVIRRASQRSQKGDRVLGSSNSTGVQGQGNGYIPPLPPSFTRPIRELRDSEDVGEYDEDGDSLLEAGHDQASIDVDPFAIPSTQPQPRASLQRRGAVAHSHRGRGDNVRRSRGSASVRHSHGHGDDDEPVEIPPTYNSLRRMSLRMSREGFTSPSAALPGNGNVSPTSPTSPMSFMGGGSPTSTSMSHTMHLPLPLPPPLPLHSLSQQLTPPLPSPAPLYTETDPIPGPEPDLEMGPGFNGETLLRDDQGIRVQDEIPIRAGSGGGGGGGVDVYNRALASTSTSLGSNHNTGVLTFDRYQSLFNPSHAPGALDGTEVSVPMFSPANATDGHGARADMNQRGFPFDSSLS